MDITKLDTVSEDEGVVVHLKDVRGTPLMDGTTPVTARVAGTYSARYRAAQKALRQNQTKLLRRGQQPDEDFLDDAQFALEAACIVEWTLTSGNFPFPVTTENWRAVAEKQPQWREQVQHAMTDHERFFVTS